MNNSEGIILSLLKDAFAVGDHHNNNGIYLQNWSRYKVKCEFTLHLKRENTFNFLTLYKPTITINTQNHCNCN